MGCPSLVVIAPRLTGVPSPSPVVEGPAEVHPPVPASRGPRHALHIVPWRVRQTGLPRRSSADNRRSRFRCPSQSGWSSPKRRTAACSQKQKWGDSSRSSLTDQSGQSEPRCSSPSYEPKPNFGPRHTVRSDTGRRHHRPSRLTAASCPSLLMGYRQSPLAKHLERTKLASGTKSPSGDFMRDYRVFGA